VTQLLQLAKEPLGNQRPSNALLEMKALARLPPAADRTARRLDLLRALWLLLLPENIRAVIPNTEEMDEADLQEMADHLNDAHASAARFNSAPARRGRHCSGQPYSITRPLASNTTAQPTVTTAAKNSPTAFAVFTPGCPWQKNV